MRRFSLSVYMLENSAAGKIFIKSTKSLLIKVINLIVMTAFLGCGYRGGGKV